MEALNQKAKIDNQIMKTIKVEEISHILAKTNRGELTMRLVRGGVGLDYRFFLDAVPFDDKDNEYLLELFTPLLFK